VEQLADSTGEVARVRGGNAGKELSENLYAGATARFFECRSDETCTTLAKVFVLPQIEPYGEVSIT
jgi:hypothetical protein